MYPKVLLVVEISMLSKLNAKINFKLVNNYQITAEYCSLIAIKLMKQIVNFYQGSKAYFWRFKYKVSV